MKIKIEISEEEKQEILVKHIKNSLPSGYEPIECYTGLGEYTFEKIEDENTEEHD